MSWSKGSDCAVTDPNIGARKRTLDHFIVALLVEVQYSSECDLCCQLAERSPAQSVQESIVYVRSNAGIVNPPLLRMRQGAHY